MLLQHILKNKKIKLSTPSITASVQVVLQATDKFVWTKPKGRKGNKTMKKKTQNKMKTKNIWNSQGKPTKLVGRKNIFKKFPEKFGGRWSPKLFTSLKKIWKIKKDSKNHLGGMALLVQSFLSWLWPGQQWIAIKKVCWFLVFFALSPPTLFFPILSWSHNLERKLPGIIKISFNLKK